MTTFSRRAACWIVSIGTPLLACASVSRATDAPAETATFLLKGVEASRSQLLRGIAHVRGAKVQEQPPFGKHEGEVHFFVAFDFERDCVRFDREEPVMLQKPGTPQVGPPKPGEDWTKRFEERAVLSQFARNPAESAWFSNAVQPTSVELHQTNKRPSQIWSRPFDVRCAGMSFWQTFVGGTRFEKVMEGWKIASPDEVTDEGNGVYRLCWTFPVQRRTLWIDEGQGFSPVRMAVQVRGPGAKEWSGPMVTNEATWAKLSGVWVPASFRIDSRSREEYVSYVLTFDWESVNERVDDALFHYQSFTVPVGTSVADFRAGGGQPVIVDVMGKQQKAPEVREAAPSGFGTKRIVLIAVNVLIVVLLLFVMALRHFRSAASTGPRL